MGVKLAVDIGGTFTDLIFIDEDSRELNVVKVPSRPKNPEKAVEDGLEKVTELYGIRPEEMVFFIAPLRCAGAVSFPYDYLN